MTALQAEVKPHVSPNLLPPKNKALADAKSTAEKEISRMALTHFEAELYVAFMTTVSKPKSRHAAITTAHSWIIEHAEETDPSKCHPMLWAEATKVMKSDGEGEEL
jgi:hypothetical protein